MLHYRPNRSGTLSLNGSGRCLQHAKSGTREGRATESAGPLPSRPTGLRNSGVRGGGAERAGPETSLVSRSQGKAHGMPLIAHPSPLEFPFCLSLVFFFAFRCPPALAFHQLKRVLQLCFRSWSPFVGPSPGQSFLEDSAARPLGRLRAHLRPLQPREGLGHSCVGTSRPSSWRRDPGTWAGADTCRRGCAVRSLLSPRGRDGTSA